MQKLIHSLEKTAVDTGFSGVISIFKGTGSVFNKAYGYRDIKNKLPNQTDTIFGTASGTKLFTALGIGKLIDQGMLSLDTPVGEIDREYKGFIAEQATIQQLLTHTSGIYDYYDEEIQQDSDHFFVEIPWSKLETPSDYYPLFRNKTMKLQPGERYSYSNGGYVFLAMLIEKVTGMLYRDFIQEQVLKAANMRHSGFFAFNDLPANTAIGYLQDRQTSNIYVLPLRGGGDGGMFTTTADLHAFWDAFLSYKILSEALTAHYLKTYCQFNETAGYGCGVYKRLDNSMFYISGSDAGVGFDSRYVVKDHVTINILSNITDGEEGMRDVILEYLARNV